MMALVDAGQLGAAIDQARTVLARIPQDIDTYLLMAKTLESQGRREEARRFANGAQRLAQGSR